MKKQNLVVTDGIMISWEYDERFDCYGLDVSCFKCKNHKGEVIYRLRETVVHGQIGDTVDRGFINETTKEFEIPFSWDIEFNAKEE